MLSRPLIVGSRGNMASRYTAILRHLEIEPLGVEVGEPTPKGFDSIIICTPTYRHVEDIRFAISAGVPVMCEKPVSTNIDEVMEICDDAEAAGLKLRMVNQYAELDSRAEGYATHYNYFKHGGDGLAWDCISLIGLAKGFVELYDDSPLWTCILNGRRLNLADMDGAYVSMLQNWLEDPSGNIPYIRHAHRAVEAYIKESKCVKS